MKSDLHVNKLTNNKKRDGQINEEKNKENDMNRNMTNTTNV